MHCTPSPCQLNLNFPACSIFSRGDTQRQAQELISGTCLGAKAKFLSFDRTQSRAVRLKEETSAHVLCECEALASFRHMYPGSFFLEPEDMKNISLGAIWNFSKVRGFP